MEDKTLTASKRIIPTEQEIPTLYENAIEKMLAEMPRCQTQRQAARWIYINLGKLLAYDERYTVGNRRQQIKLFRLAKVALDNNMVEDPVTMLTWITLLSANEQTNTGRIYKSLYLL